MEKESLFSERRISSMSTNSDSGFPESPDGSESGISVSSQNNGKISKENSEPLLKKLRNTSDLQIKLEKQLERSRKTNGSKKLLQRNRLLVPGKGGFTDMRPEEAPLVSVSDNEFEDVTLGEDEIIFQQPSSPFNFGSSSSSSPTKGPQECTQQLLKDGYRLDELSDDEDLDLIVPRSGESSWCSCERYCVIQ